MAPSAPLTVEDDIRTLSAAMAIADHDDVLCEILVRIPAASLVRFQSVSKHWLSLISSHDFSVLLRKSSNLKLSSGFLLCKMPRQGVADFEFLSPNSSLSGARPPFKSLNFIQINGNFSGISIRQSCNGLLICYSVQHRSYYVLNPTTRQYIELYPPRDCASINDTFFWLHIAFDPSKSPHYKVICVSALSNRRYQIEIYSSETRRWRVSGNSFMAGRYDSFKQGVYWNGNIHWSGAWLRFSVDLECIEQMPKVPVLFRRDSGSRGYRFFGESNGHLHLVEGQTTMEFQVFEMESDYSGWFVKYHVDLGSYTEPYFVGDYYDLSILAVICEENEDESVLFFNVPGKIVSYNFKDGTLKELLDLAPENIDWERPGLLQFTYCSTFQYIESYAPV